MVEIEPNNTVLFFIVMIAFIAVFATLTYAVVLNAYNKKIVDKLENIEKHTAVVKDVIQDYKEKKDEIHDNGD